MEPLIMVSRRQRGWLSKRRPLALDEGVSHLMFLGPSCMDINECILAVAFYGHDTGIVVVTGGHPEHNKTYNKDVDRDVDRNA